MAAHGSWAWNFPWSRIPGVELPEVRKAAVELAPEELKAPRTRAKVGDGSLGGRYWRPEDR